MVKVKMLRTQPGCPDGITQKLYEAGQEYSTSSNLARIFCEIGAAEEVSAKMVRESPKNKDMGPAPKDKKKAVEDPTVVKLPDRKIDAEVLMRMDRRERAEYSKLIRRMIRPQLEEFIDSNELPVPYKKTWRDETICKRVIEVLGL